MIYPLCRSLGEFDSFSGNPLLLSFIGFVVNSREDERQAEERHRTRFTYRHIDLLALLVSSALRPPASLTILIYSIVL